jgi:hypothetical protein
MSRIGVPSLGNRADQRTLCRAVSGEVGRVAQSARHCIIPPQRGALPCACPRWRDNVTDDCPGFLPPACADSVSPSTGCVHDNSAITASESDLSD